MIFFCSCKGPRGCHREIFARLLVKAARREKQILTVVEWPGGAPVSTEIAVVGKVIGNILHGSNRVPLKEQSNASIRRLAGLPWCSRVNLKSEMGDLAIISGPAHAGTDWYLPVIGPAVSKEGDTPARLEKSASRLRKSLGYDPTNSEVFT